MRLNHVTLIVTELRRSLRFYRALGLVPIVHEPPRYARLQSPDGDWTLSIEVTGEAALPPRVQLYFECEALDERVALLRAVGLAVPSAAHGHGLSVARGAAVRPRWS